MSEADCLYTESHEWIENSGDARRIGITAHAQQMMGDIVFADLPPVGKVLSKGDEILVIESPKAAASVYAPMGGEVVAVNEALSGDPALINRDPLGEGWIVMIKPSNPGADTAGLKDHAAYMASLG